MPRGVSTKRYNRTCPICGKEFIAKHIDAGCYCLSCRIKVWKRDNKDKVKAHDKRYYQRHKEKLKPQHQKWKQDNKEELKVFNLKYRQEHKEESRISNRKRKRERRKTEPMFRLNCNMATAIGHSLKGNKGGRKWEILVGYTLKELKEHLEKQFTPIMNWNDSGVWELDHKKPISWFHFTSVDDKEFKECWALSNLQPMLKEENMSKGNRYIG